MSIDFLINIFFRLLNFGALVGVFVYVFKHYLLPDILADMTQKEQERIASSKQ